jgi:cytidylate kinase
MSLVALSGAYGAGGSRIGPALAERLGVPFLDRAIPAAVAEELAVPLDEAAAHDEQVSASWLERLLSGFIGQDTVGPAPLAAGIVSPDDFRRATEEILMRQAETGRGVILGRAAVVVLRDNPRALRVRLDGPPERRIEQAMRIEGIDRETAERRQRHLDRAHAAYLKHFYGSDLRDLSLYHVVLDSTAIPLDTCAAILASAARSLAAGASPASVDRSQILDPP